MFLTTYDGLPGKDGDRFLAAILQSAPFERNLIKRTVQSGGLEYSDHITFLAIFELTDGYFTSVHSHYSFDQRKIYNTAFAEGATLKELVDATKQHLDTAEKDIFRFCF
ncbi:MAG: hypothetical protein KGJ89_04745 [Patescibacteria group bacterium]|nr:hypothetical protein [Patescibacteria group bacterium]MDE2015574.1 hypothetical protein [Patescibacteria group bacterium]MDE2227230.1 hypothetical protein [Patescibacteria group bacterium]